MHSEGNSNWLYSKELPPRKDLKQRQKEVKLVTPARTSSRPRLDTELGQLRRLPQRHKKWHTSEDESELYKEGPVDSYTKYDKYE